MNPHSCLRSYCAHLRSSKHHSMYSKTKNSYSISRCVLVDTEIRMCEKITKTRPAHSFAIKLIPKIEHIKILETGPLNTFRYIGNPYKENLSPGQHKSVYELIIQIELTRCYATCRYKRTSGLKIQVYW